MPPHMRELEQGRSRMCIVDERVVTGQAVRLGCDRCVRSNAPEEHHADGVENGLGVVHKSAMDLIVACGS